MPQEKTKVYIYTRVSTAMQIDGYSLDAQKARMKAYADFNDSPVFVCCAVGSDDWFGSGSALELLAAAFAPQAARPKAAALEKAAFIKLRLEIFFIENTSVFQKSRWSPL